MNIKLSAEDQLADEVLILEIAYLNLYRAYHANDREAMIESYAMSELLAIPYFKDRVLRESRKVFNENGIAPSIIISVEFMPLYHLRFNVVGCMNALQYEIDLRKIYKTNYTYAQRILYQPNHIFTNNEVLYHNQEGQQLKVSDLLKVFKYAIGIAEAIATDNEGFAKANASISAFQALGAILSNKPEDKPVNKTLHLVVSFLSSEVKKSLQENETKRDVTITTMLLDLAIDFFCRK